MKESDEIGLSKDEIQMFKNIERMENVHNLLAIGLSRYKESIVKVRNDYVKSIVRKYNISNPSMVTFCPVREKIVSVLNSKLSATKMIINANHQEVADKELMKLIKDISDAIK